MGPGIATALAACSGGVPPAVSVEATVVASADTARPTEERPDPSTVPTSSTPDTADTADTAEPPSPTCVGQQVFVDGVAHAGLQEALDGAIAGATVVVCPGTWSGTFVAEVPVVLESDGSALDTELDGGGAGTVLTLVASSEVRGLTIRGGDATEGGGLRVEGPGTLLVQDCVIRDNRATRGGGLWATEVALDLTGTEIHANTADQEGGGLVLQTGEITGGEIRDNHADGWLCSGGGGLSLEGTVTIDGTEIAANTSACDGGGIAVAVVWGDTVTLQDVQVVDNIASQYGGGFYGTAGRLVLAGSTALERNTGGSGGGAYVAGMDIEGGVLADNIAGSGGGLFAAEAAISDATIRDNTATWDGGGIYASGSVTLGDVEVAGNHADRNGGGVVLNGSDSAYGYSLATLLRVRVQGNQAMGDGGGVWSDGDGYPTTLQQCELIENVASDGGGMWADGRTTLIDSVVERNTATGGGAGVALGPVGWLSSDGSDWGALVDDNAPDDVSVGGVGFVGYDASETFTCNGTTCTPAP